MNRACAGFTRIGGLVYSIPFCLAAQAALGNPLDPAAFTPMGTLSLNSGVVTIDTDTLQITGGGGLSSTSGVLHSQGVGNPDVAVFTFDGVNIGSGVTFQTIGSRPLAILSRNDLRVLTSIDVSGAAGTNGATGGNGPNGTNGVAGSPNLNSGGFGASATPANFPGGKGGDGGYSTQKGVDGSDGAFGGGPGGPGGAAFNGNDFTTGGAKGSDGIHGSDGNNGNFGSGGAARSGPFVLAAGANGTNGQAGTAGHGGGGGGGAGGRHGTFPTENSGKGSGGGSGGCGAAGGGAGLGGAGGNAIELGAMGELLVSSVLAKGGNGGLGGTGGIGGDGGLGGPAASQVGKGGDGGDGGNGGNGGFGGGGTGGIVFLHGGAVRVTQPFAMNGGGNFLAHGADGLFKLAGTLQLDVESASTFDRVDVLGDYDTAGTAIRFELANESIADSFTTLFNFDSFFAEDLGALADITQFQSLDISAVSPNRQFDITLNADHTFAMTAVPEPLAITVVTPLVASTFLRRRRRD